MLVAANNSHHHGLGCNISVTLSDGQFVDNMNESNNQFSPNVSPKKTSFLDSLIRRNSSDNNTNNKKEKKSPTQSSWPNIFTRNKQSQETTKVQQADEDMAKLIVEMELEGRSEAEIRMHLSYIHDVRTAPPAPASPVTPTRAAAPKANVVTQFFRDVQTAFREEVLMIHSYPEYEIDDVSGLTISISSAPFFGAPPPEMDLTYEELSNLEPVYVGSRSINNLPTCKYDGTPLPGDQTKCPVCICEFTEGEELKSLPCVHFYHKECIDRWLMVGHSCPMCKTLVE